MKFWRALGLLLLLSICIAAGAAAWWLNRPLVLAADRIELSIEPGTSPRGIAQAWVRAGVEAPPWLLYEWFRWSGRSRQIRAGSYEIEREATPVTLLEKMVQGDEILSTVRLIDGWTFLQFRAELASSEALRPVTASMTDAAIMQAIGAPAGESPEGRFACDTYAFSKGTSDLEVLKRAYRSMQKELAAAWQQRSADTPLHSPDEALVLASIVEKETGIGADRGRIAAVFVNRLRIGMPLQTDPTVIYGLGATFDGNLRKRDLLADTPYNTYIRIGLPPTPISMPGKASLLAAVRPEVTKELFFVSRGDGSSQFSESLVDHNRAVNQYQRKK